MRIEVMTIGDELLDGIIVDSNAAWLGAELETLGLGLSQITTLRDDLPTLVDALRAVAARADICITTGGLGPTLDDLTVDALAAAANVGLAHDDEAWRRIQVIYGDRPIPPSNRRQARIPDGGQALQSEVGTAPGVRLTVDRCTFFCLPGVQREMRWHFDRAVRPEVEARREGPPLRSRTLRFAMIGESSLAQQIEAAGLPTAAVQVAYRTRGPENQVRLRSLDPDALDAAVVVARAAAPTFYVGEGPLGPVEVLAARLAERGLTFGAAESCTGGLLGATLTDVPGISSVFAGSIVAYANPVKVGVLGVRQETLDTHGAVSEECAREMAEGARRALGVDIAVSITGVAGPGGGTPEKPVGTVWFGWSGAGLDATRVLQIPGDRARVRKIAVMYALHRVLRGLSREEMSDG